MPDCPYCKCLLSDEEMYDWDDYKDKVIIYYRGYCPNCGVGFKWGLVCNWDGKIANLKELE